MKPYWSVPRASPVPVLVVVTLLAATASVAASETVYLGTDETWDEPYGSGETNCLESGDYTNCYTHSYPDRGEMHAWSEAFDSSDDGEKTYAAAGSEIHERVDVVRRCEDQQNSLPVKLSARYSVAGATREDNSRSLSYPALVFSQGDPFETGIWGDWVGYHWPGDGSFYEDSTRLSFESEFAIGTTYELQHRLTAYSEGKSPDGLAEADFHAKQLGASHSDQDGATLKEIRVSWVDRFDPRHDASVSSADKFKGWHSSPVDVTVHGWDEESCAKIIGFKADGSSSYDHKEVDPEESPETWTVHTTTGEHTDNYRVRDHSGNVAYGSISYKVDANPPTTEDTVKCSRSPQGHCEDSARVEFDCSDPETRCDDGSIRYRVDGGPWQQGNSVTIRERGEHTVEYYGTDELGNEEPVRQRKITIVCGGTTGPAERLVGRCLPT